MANNGTLTKKIRSDLKIRIVYSAVQNEKTNSSTVTATMYVDRQYSMYSTVNYYLNLDGTTKSGSIALNTSTGKTFTIAKITKTIKHNTAGDASFRLGGYVDFRSTSLSGQIINKETVTTKTITLNRIERAATGKVANFTFGNPIKLTITNPKPENTVSAGLWVNGVWIENWGNTRMENGKTYSLELEAAKLNKVYDNSPNTTEPTVKVKVWTSLKNGGSITTETKAKGTLPASLKPIVGGLNHSETNTANKTGDYLRYISEINLTADNVQMARGAKLKEIAYYIKNGSEILQKKTVKTNTGVVMDPVKFTGRPRFIAVVTDSRGRSTQVEASKYISAYRYPEIIKMSIARSGTSGQVNPAGTSVLLVGEVYGASVSGQNPIKYKVEYKPSGGGTWKTGATWTEVNMSWDRGVKINKNINGIADLSSSFDIRLTVWDMFKKVVWTGSIANGAPLMVYSKNGIAFGGFPSSHARFSFVGDLAIDGRIVNYNGNSSQNNKARMGTYSTGKVFYRRTVNGNITVWGEITVTNSKGLAKFKPWASIPSDFAPTYDVPFAAADGDKHLYGMQISPSGNISFAGAYGINATPKVNQLYKFQILYGGKGAW